MRFAKVKWDGAEVRLEWAIETDSETHEHKLRCHDAPAPEFTAAIDQLKAPVLDLLQLPEGYGEDMDVRVVSLTYDGSTAVGAVISCVKAVPYTPSPLNISTPYLRAPEDDDDGSVAGRLFGAIAALQREAQRYVQGHRAQGELFETEAAEGD